jgi:hypothetical protein
MCTPAASVATEVNQPTSPLDATVRGPTSVQLWHAPWLVQLCPVGQAPQLVPQRGSGPQTLAPHWGVQQALLAQTSPEAQQLFPHAR